MNETFSILRLLQPINQESLKSNNFSINIIKHDDYIAQKEDPTEFPIKF